MAELNTSDTIIGKELYGYQKDALQEIFRRFEDAPKDYHLLYQLPTGGGKTVTFSVNVSAFDITGPYFVLNVQDCLDRTGLAPNLLCLEITESAFMAEPEKSLNRLHLLKDKGLKLSIDDYGTGMASLAYVRDLPVDELKVDRSFITWIHKQDRNAAIVKNTISMCHDLNISIVAEGVETMDEFNWINTHGFDQAQGYFISHPLTIEELTRKLSEGS